VLELPRIDVGRAEWATLRETRIRGLARIGIIDETVFVHPVVEFLVASVDDVDISSAFGDNVFASTEACTNLLLRGQYILAWIDPFPAVHSPIDLEVLASIGREVWDLEGS